MPVGKSPVVSRQTVRQKLPDAPRRVRHHQPSAMNCMLLILVSIRAVFGMYQAVGIVKVFLEFFGVLSEIVRKP